MIIFETTIKKIMESQEILVYILAVFFAGIGFSKLKIHWTKLAFLFPWAKDFKPVTIRFIGFMELLAAGLLILPFITGKVFAITSWTAIFLCILMALAGIYHSRKREYKWLFINIAIFVLTLLVAFHYK